MDNISEKDIIENSAENGGTINASAPARRRPLAAFAIPVERLVEELAAGTYVEETPAAAEPAVVEEPVAVETEELEPVEALVETEEPVAVEAFAETEEPAAVEEPEADDFDIKDGFDETDDFDITDADDFDIVEEPEAAEPAAEEVEEPAATVEEEPVAAEVEEPEATAEEEPAVEEPETVREPIEAEAAEPAAVEEEPIAAEVEEEPVAAEEEPAVVEGPVEAEVEEPAAAEPVSEETEEPAAATEPAAVEEEIEEPAAPEESATVKEEPVAAEEPIAAEEDTMPGEPTMGISVVEKSAADKPGAEQPEPEGNVKEKNRNSVMKAMDFIIPFACIIIFLVAALQLVRTYLSYKAASSEYAELAEEYVDNYETVDLTAEPVYFSDDEDRGERPHFLNLGVDFKALEAINEDVVGWLYVPTLQISYPVVHGEDNDHYLHYTYEGTNNSSGSIFLDCDSAVDMTDRNTFIYGHNMRNGSMFGSLKKFREDPTLVDMNPYVYYYTKDHAYKYRIFAYYITQTGGEAYFNFKSDAEYDAYINKVAMKTEYYKWDGTDFTGRRNILTLSTCSGSHSKNRMVTHCILVDDYAMDE